MWRWFLKPGDSERYVLPKRKEIWRLGEDQQRGQLGGRAGRAGRGAGKALSWTPVKEACEPRLSRVRVQLSVCWGALCFNKEGSRGVCVCRSILVTADPGSGKGENKGDVGLGTVK